jgi:hypothetical protein
MERLVIPPSVLPGLRASMEALHGALADAERTNSTWAKLSCFEVRGIIEHLQHFEAALRVPVIDGEFVDAAALYTALGIPQPERTSGTYTPPAADAPPRADYEAERARVDKLIDGLLAVLANAELG